jgi:hypothetical protein
MKAKHFKKLRATCQWYDVETTTSLFGSFEWTWDRSIRVLAKSHREACYRVKRRGYGLTKSIGDGTTENWARWRVKLSSKSDNFKNVAYF